ncbi:hypothetical protein HBA55_35990 [Pseudomaricurvus alkylphenolicus]|uniref:hypothetical protein n=1 Tax=Pseudomaricurvus alkylphenolicus TaxID=1306991 RepID=UPI001423A77E|nr:hypothetical protein [Pseudomaricurvus alkylphenolicus]NIB45036.1 hypothetical protein [Pseudomaricurvus alkylphenolicus]
MTGQNIWRQTVKFDTTEGKLSKADIPTERKEASVHQLTTLFRLLFIAKHHTFSSLEMTALRHEAEIPSKAFCIQISIYMHLDAIRIGNYQFGILLATTSIGLSKFKSKHSPSAM